MQTRFLTPVYITLKKAALQLCGCNKDVPDKDAYGAERRSNPFCSVPEMRSELVLDLFRHLAQGGNRDAQSRGRSDAKSGHAFDGLDVCMLFQVRDNLL